MSERIISSAFVLEANMRPTTFVQFRRETLYPAIKGRMGDSQAAIQHHFGQTPVADRIAQIPPNTKQDDLGLEVPPFETVFLSHDGITTNLASSCNGTLQIPALSIRYPVRLPSYLDSLLLICGCIVILPRHHHSGS